MRKYIIPITLFLISISPVKAAELYLYGQEKIEQGDQFVINLFLDTNNENVNAVGGKVFFERGIKPIRIETASSVIGVWNEFPKISSTSSFISFSGIIPWGFNGSNGTLMRLYFQALDIGRNNIKLIDPAVYRNDGLGSSVSVATKNIDIDITPQIGEGITIKTKDEFPPESFQPYVIENQNLFDGKYVLIFQTQDKQTAVDYYEVAEVARGGKKSPIWNKAESPYLLKDQTLSSDIYVRAVDTAGNFIIAQIPAKNQSSLNQKSIFLVPPAILYVLAILLLLYGCIKIYYLLIKKDR